MKVISKIFLALVTTLFVSTQYAFAQQSAGNKPSAGSEPQAPQEKSDLPAAELISQGKALYRTAKFKMALAKFEAALEQEKDNDEALGLAAETSFRLDSQGAARDYFLRRAELPGQKDSVKAYSYHRAAMTCWREAHDLVAKYIELKNGKVTHNFPESAKREASETINNGIEYATRALNLRSSFADAYNIRNLLHAEAAIMADDETWAKNSWQKSLDDLRMALSMSKPVLDSKFDAADFNFPTIRVSEFSRTKEEQDIQGDELLKIIEGGKPLKRVQPIFPSTRPGKPADPNAPAPKYTLTSGKVKVEVLVSTEGKVIFSHIIDGRSELNSAAILAARGWTFEPAMLDGQPIQISGVISFDVKPARAQAPPTQGTASATPTRKP